jgi:hypothetical protein
MKSGIFGLFGDVQCESLQNGCVLARRVGCGLKSLWTRDGAYMHGDLNNDDAAQAVAAFIARHR